MLKVQSINQNRQSDALPDFRNMGVIMRSVLLVNCMALLLTLSAATAWADIALRMTEISALLQPVLLADLLLLFAFNSMLQRMSYWKAAAIVVLLTGGVTQGIDYLGGELFVPLFDRAYFHSGRLALLSITACMLLLAYFRLRALALSPSLQESRLQALQARIRPHFLFNSINAVLGIVRADPKRAETALEDMSDLFRMAMAYNSDLVSIRQELALARQYLALEQLRLGDRLQVSWHTQDMPEDALLPPLVLQPLLENAVYHGIEPLTEGGLIDVRLYRSGNEMHLEMYNPRQEQGSHHAGNKMALANIRERLALLFDIEAHYTVESGKDFYRVHIKLPYVKGDQNVFH